MGTPISKSAGAVVMNAQVMPGRSPALRWQCQDAPRKITAAPCGKMLRFDLERMKGIER
jgi:hypothetical protein